MKATKFNRTNYTSGSQKNSQWAIRLNINEAPRGCRVIYIHLRFN